MFVAFASASLERPLYRRDVLNSVCYSNGWFLRLTYREKWIQDENLRSQIENNELAGQKILLIFCGDPDSKGNYRLFIPLRFAQVLQSSLEDDVYVIRLTLKKRPGRNLVDNIGQSDQGLRSNFPSVKNGAYFRELAIDADDGVTIPWSEQLKRLKGAPELNKSKFARIIKFSKRDSWFARKVAGWRPKSKSLNWLASKLRKFRGSRREAQASKLMSPSKKLSDVSEARLKAGTAYVLVFEVPELTQEEANLPEVLVVGSHIEQAEPVIHQRGKGAEISYLLSVQRKYAGELATLVARIPSSEPGSKPRACGVQHPDGAPEFQTLLRITPGFLFWPITILFLILGLLALNATPEMLESFGFEAGKKYVGIVKAIGAVILALMGAYSFRRLPVKV